MEDGEWLHYQYLAQPPEVGKRLYIVIGEDDTILTTEITEIH
jgi:hypothetical protein